MTSQQNRLPLLNEKEVAKLLGISLGLVRKLRRTKAGPQVVKINRAVRYTAEGVEEFVRANAVVSPREI